MLLLREELTRPERTPEGAEQPTDVTADRRWLCCRVCGARIAPSAAEFHPSSGPLVFANPQGRLYELIAVRDASGMHVLGSPTTEATWFAGYAWRVAICATCLNHLGWNYSAAASGVTPVSFYGLIRAELIETADDAKE